jgi:hypothetical protein
MKTTTTKKKFPKFRLCGEKLTIFLDYFETQKKVNGWVTTPTPVPPFSTGSVIIF